MKNISNPKASPLQAMLQETQGQPPALQQAWQAHALKLKAFAADPRETLIDCNEQNMRTQPARSIWRQRMSRSQILSAVRRLVPEIGIDNMHVSTIADEAGFSPQTLYNLVGGLSEMIVSATNEWYIVTGERAEKLAASRDLNVVFTLVDFVWLTCINDRERVPNILPKWQREELMRQHHLAGRRVIEDQLKRLRAENALAHWVNEPMLATASMNLILSAVRDWMCAPYDESQFRETLVNSAGLLLRGALQGEEISRLERSFRGAWM